MVTLTEINNLIKKTIIYSFICLSIIILFVALFSFVFIDELANDISVLILGSFITLEVNGFIQLFSDIYIKSKIKTEDACYNWSKINRIYLAIFLVSIIPISVFILISSMINNLFIILPIIIAVILICNVSKIKSEWLFILIFLSLCSFSVIPLINHVNDKQLSPNIQLEEIFLNQSTSRKYVDKCYDGVLASCLKQDVYITSDNKFFYYYYYYFKSNYCGNALNKIKKVNIKDEYHMLTLDNHAKLYYLYDNEQGHDFTQNIYIIETNNSLMSFTTNAEIKPLDFNRLIIADY